MNSSIRPSDTAQLDHNCLVNRFVAVRKQTEMLCKNLEPDDYGLQSVAEASPPKWHIAHVTWFFETFILKKYVKNYRPFNSQFEVLFNSYYNGIGKQYPRAKRNLLSRPTIDQVFQYRHIIDEQIISLLIQSSSIRELLKLVELGIEHEQQHQELLLTDLKHHFFQNPLYPEYQTPKIQHSEEFGVHTQLDFFEYTENLVKIGYSPNSNSSFCFDNELPQHKYYLSEFGLANRLITNAEYLDFMLDGGYQSPLLWLSDGWAKCQTLEWQSPLYWLRKDGEWFEFTLHGLEPLNPLKPVSHISFYEAQAYASWANKRLPSEQEWEHVASEIPVEGNFQEQTLFEAVAQSEHQAIDCPAQLYGNLWEWTQSAYQPYPGFKANAGAVGEYNGKFMCNQLVLKGGSCATVRSQIRSSYRNFFYPADRWQFMGLRLALSL